MRDADYTLALSDSFEYFSASLEFCYFSNPILGCGIHRELLDEFFSEIILKCMHALLHHEVIFYERSEVDFCTSNQVVEDHHELTDGLVVFLHDGL